MTTAERIVRIVAASLATLFSAWFVCRYDSLKYNNEVVYGGVALPPFTAEVHDLAAYAMAVPLGVLALGLVLCRKDIPVAVITSIAWLFALCWPLFGLLVWQIAITVLRAA